MYKNNDYLYLKNAIVKIAPIDDSTDRSKKNEKLICKKCIVTSLLLFFFFFFFFHFSAEIDGNR